MVRSFTTIFALVGVFCFPMDANSQYTQHKSSLSNILEGNWQSCNLPGVGYSERIYDHVVNGVGLFEVHLGPWREFAIFDGIEDEHREHNSPDNLLKPFLLELQNGKSKHRWEIRIAELNLEFEVALAGGSRGECESWYIILKPKSTTSH